MRENHDDDAVKEHLLLFTNKMCELENSNYVDDLQRKVEDFKEKVAEARRLRTLLYAMGKSIKFTVQRKTCVALYPVVGATFNNLLQ